jgi:hypothetical protein
VAFGACGDRQSDQQKRKGEWEQTLHRSHSIGAGSGL